MKNTLSVSDKPIKGVETGPIEISLGIKEMIEREIINNLKIERYFKPERVGTVTVQLTYKDKRISEVDIY